MILMIISMGHHWKTVRYFSAGIVVRTTKINFHIKEAKATPFTPVLLRVPQRWPNWSGLSFLYVEIYFSGSNHYTSAGTTKINFHRLSLKSPKSLKIMKRSAISYRLNENTISTWSEVEDRLLYLIKVLSKYRVRFCDDPL